MSNSFDKLSVLDPFIEEVNSYLPEIEANLERLAASPGDMDALEETYRRTHTIGGSASMMDFLGLAHVAHGMEDILGDALEGLAPLDEPTIGFLQRSLARLYQLVGGIRTGINEDAVIAEDDADYSSYRAAIEARAHQTQQEMAPQPQNQATYQAREEEHTAPQPMLLLPPEPQIPYISAQSPTLPSFDEVLASFKMPSVEQGEEIGWPEEPAPAPHFEEAQLAYPQPRAEAVPVQPVQPSALDTLVASTRQALPESQPPVQEWQDLPEYASFQSPPPTPSVPQTTPEYWQFIGEEEERSNLDVVPMQQAIVPEGLTTGNALPKVYDDMQQDAQALEAQSSSLEENIVHLRSAIALIDAQRNEFRGFLDGSKDALDRMEDWAGQAMGLNLRNSPEQVRRYLPLSVMWVSNSKLKKVLELLKQVTGGVEATDEHMRLSLQQLQQSINVCGEEFQQLQAKAAYTFTQEPGWTPWEMQVARDAGTFRERVTFERQGDPVTMRSEMEAKLRDELRREFEVRSTTLAARAELEQQVREEFEANRRLHDRLVGPTVGESNEELEARLRNEIEIEVRQEFLDQIMHGEVDGSLTSLQMLASPSSPAPTTSNFLDRAREATGQTSPRLPAIQATTQATQPAPPQPAQTAPPVVAQTPPQAPPITPPLPVQPQPIAPPQPAKSTGSGSATYFSGDVGEEAAEIFRLEAEEHLQTISMHVAALEKDPTNRELIQGIRRATHTLKGAAAMMGFRAIADLSHISEDLLDSIMEGTTAISPAVLSMILDTAETLDILIMGKSNSQEADDARVQVLRIRYTELLGEQHVSHLPLDEDIDLDAEVGEHAGPASVTGTVEGVPTGSSRSSHSDLSVRVRLQKLDELVNLFGELLVNRSVLEERIERLVRLVADVGVSSNRLRDVGQRLESRFEAATLPSGRSLTVMPGEGTQGKSANGRSGAQPAHLEDFDELELDRYTEFHQLARGLSEGISDMTTLSTEMDAVIRECEGVFQRENRLSTTFQDRLMKVRLVPISTMAPRLYRAASAVALKQHKEFEFMLEGVETEVDRTVYEEIAGPLLHLMRNAINHAIETPEQRIQRGKPPTGQIKLSAAYEGNQVTITVRDDGTGIDPEHVRNAAISRGLIRPEQMLSHADLIYLIFRPGFSTAEVLSEESGRGVGLDVVRDSVSRLRGSIEVDSTPGQGTAFTMRFPTSMAIQSAMMVRVSDQLFAIPTVMVEAIGRLDNFKRTTSSGQPAVVVRNDLYPLNSLAQYLSLPISMMDEKAPLLLVNANGHHVALVVDEIKGKSDIVMKSLGTHLRQVHGIAGGTVLGNGQVVLILELNDLLATRRLVTNVSGTEARKATTNSLRWEGPVPASTPAVSQARQGVDLAPARSSIATRPPQTPVLPERAKHILVVDDSPSVRRVVGNMLKQHNWEVQMARDGIEALEMITHETPAAVLLDIEMPRMDGYELTATLRAQAQYRTLPLIVLTSRAAGKHQQRAMQLGASAYVVKPYQDEELLNTINSLVYGTVTR